MRVLFSLKFRTSSFLASKASSDSWPIRSKANFTTLDARIKMLRTVGGMYKDNIQRDRVYSRYSLLNEHSLENTIITTVCSYVPCRICM